MWPPAWAAAAASNRRDRAAWLHHLLEALEDKVHMRRDVRVAHVEALRHKVTHRRPGVFAYSKSIYRW